MASALLLLSLCVSAATASTIYITGALNNDVARLLLANPPGNATVKRTATAAVAIAAAGPGDAVLLLADGYPAQRTAIPADLQRSAATKGFRAYMEFPSDPAPSNALSWKQRAVVTTHELAACGLDQFRILQLQDPIAVDWCGAAQRCANPDSACANACNNSLLSFAQIAGVDTAAFGVKASERIPLLFRQSASVLVAAAKLSNMASGRYAPQEAWRQLWGSILDELLAVPPGTLAMPVWQAVVRPAYAEFEQLPANALSTAVAASAAWLSTGSELMTVADRVPNATFGCCAQSGGNQECTLKLCNWTQVCPAPRAPPGVTNVTCIQEGWSSIIHDDGAQHRMPLFIRTDGNAEAQP
jgi:hypothetical protein